MIAVNIDKIQKILLDEHMLNSELRFHDLWLPLILVIVSVVLVPSVPPDDLNRHLIAYLYDYNWHNLYPYGYTPSYDPWIGFDIITGTLHKYMGYSAFIVVQVLNVALCSVALFMQMRGTQMSSGLFMFCLYLYLLMPRLLLGRPAEFVASLFFIALNCPTLPALFIMILSAPLYWLSPLIMLPAVFKRQIFIIAPVAGLCFWFAYAGMGYFESIKKLYEAMHSRVFDVAENSSVLYVVLPWLPALWPAIHNLNLLRDIKTSLTALYFMLFNQSKLVLPVILAVTGFMRLIKVKFPPYIAVLSIVLVVQHPRTEFSVDPEALSMLRNSKVLVLSFDEVPFQIVSNIYPVKMAPSMELGWTDRDIQLIIATAEKEGKLDCGLLSRYDFDYVVEDNLTEIPQCLRLASVSQKLRVWKTFDR